MHIFLSASLNFIFNKSTNLGIFFKKKFVFVELFSYAIYLLSKIFMSCKKLLGSSRMAIKNQVESLFRVISKQYRTFMKIITAIYFSENLFHDDFPRDSFQSPVLAMNLSQKLSHNKKCYLFDSREYVKITIGSK